METRIKFQEVKNEKMAHKNEEIIEFKRYDSGRKDSYTLDQDQTIMEVNCPFDKTPIVFDYEYDDFFCPNCETNYHYTDSQKNLNHQVYLVLNDLKRKTKESDRLKKRHDLLSKLSENQ